MKKPVSSPVIKFQEQPFTKVLMQTVKRPNRVPYKVKFDEVSLILVQNKVIGSLSPLSQQYLMDSFGNHSAPFADVPDEVLSQSVQSRRLQSPSEIKRQLERDLSRSSQVKKKIKFESDKSKEEVKDG